MDDRAGTSGPVARLRALVARLDRALSAISRAAIWIFEVGRDWGATTAAIGVATGLFVWLAIRHDRLPVILDNQLDHRTRCEGANTVLAAVGVTALAYGAVAIWRWRGRGAASIAPTIRGLNDRLFGLIALPFVPAIFTPRIETEAPFFSLILAAGLAAVVVSAVYRFPRRALASRCLLPAVVPTIVLGLITATYAATTTIFAWNNHHNFIGSPFDLALYDNIFWNSAHGRLLASSLMNTGVHTAAHVDPLMILLSPFYLLYPRAEFLLALQAFWISTTSIPVYLLARRHLSSPWSAVAIATAFLLHPALHGATLYAFHSLSFVAPPLAWAIYCIEVGAVRWFTVPFMLMLITREDVSLLCMFVGAYAILSRRAPRLGVVTIFVSALYIFIVKFFIMPDPGLLMDGDNESYSYSFYFADLIPQSDKGMQGLLISLMMNPFFSLRHAFEEPKIVFLMIMFVPVLHLPLLAPRGKVMMVYGLAFILLASRAPVFSVHFQYTSVLYPILFMLVPIALSELHESRLVEFLKLDAKRLVPAFVVGVLVASAAVSVEHGGLLPNASFRSGFGPLRPFMSGAAREQYSWVEATVERVPTRAAVSTSSRFRAHLSNRREIFLFPHGVGAEYLAIDTRDLDADERRYFNRLRRDAYEVIAERQERTFLLRRRLGVPLPPRDEPAQHEDAEAGRETRPATRGVPSQPDARRASRRAAGR
jgi:uncharacterized membrane protein